jgi:hypothetical protein
LSAAVFGTFIPLGLSSRYRGRSINTTTSLKTLSSAFTLYFRLFSKKIKNNFFLPFFRFYAPPALRLSALILLSYPFLFFLSRAFLIFLIFSRNFTFRKFMLKKISNSNEKRIIVSGQIDSKQGDSGQRSS